MSKTVSEKVEADSFAAAMEIAAEWKVLGFKPDAPFGDGCYILRNYSASGHIIPGSTLWLSRGDDWRSISFPD